MSKWVEDRLYRERYRVDRLHIPGQRHSLREDEGSPAGRWSHAVQRRPWLAALASTAVLVALAVPATGLWLAFPDAGNNPESTTTRQAYDLVAEGFGPGANGPLLIATKLPSSSDAKALERLAAELRAEEGVRSWSMRRSCGWCWCRP